MTSRASGLTSARSFRTRTLDQTTPEEKQMTADQNTAGASFHGVTDWHDIDWKSVSHTVRRLQARIVQATTGLPSTTAPTHLHPQENRQKASSGYSRDEV